MVTPFHPVAAPTQPVGWQDVIDDQNASGTPAMLGLTSEAPVRELATWLATTTDRLSVLDRVTMNALVEARSALQARIEGLVERVETLERAANGGAPPLGPDGAWGDRDDDTPILELRGVPESPARGEGTVIGAPVAWPAARSEEAATRTER